MACEPSVPPPHSTSKNAHLPELRVVILGDAGVGKSAFLHQYLDHYGPSPDDVYKPTLLDSYTHVTQCGKLLYRIRFTDCSSTSAFREHRAAYLAKCDVVILMFSAQHRKTLSHLHTWMKEIQEARTCTGPARFASTTGDFSEVPIFVVGTHYEKKMYTSPPSTADGLGSSGHTSFVTQSEAEEVTTECLHAAGYFIDSEDAEVEEVLRAAASKAADGKRSKPKPSSRAFGGFFADLFRSTPNQHSHCSSTVGGEADNSKSTKAKAVDRTGKPVKKGHETPSKSVPAVPLSMSLPSSFEAGGSATLASSGLGATIHLPHGASARLPLYMLSNTDLESVRMAVRVSLALPIWLRQFAASSEDVSNGVTPLPSPRPRSTSPSSAVAHPALSTMVQHGGCTSPAEGSAAVSVHGRSVSGASHVSDALGGSLMPTMHALYGSVASLSALEGVGAIGCHSRLSSYGQGVEGNSPVARVHNGEQQQQRNHHQLLIRVEGQHGIESGSWEPSEGRGPHNGSPWVSPMLISPVNALRHSKERGEGSFRTNTMTVDAIMIKSPAPASSPSPLSPPAAISRRGSAVADSFNEPATASNNASTEPLNEPLPDLTHDTTSIYVSSPANPRQPTAPNTAVRRADEDAHPTNISYTPQHGEYSALSAAAAASEWGTSPGAASGETPAPRRALTKVDSGSAFSQRQWKDVDAAEAPKATTTSDLPVSKRSSVVKRLALDHEGKSGEISLTAPPPPGTGEEEHVPFDDGFSRGATPRLRSHEHGGTPRSASVAKASEAREESPGVVVSGSVTSPRASPELAHSRSASHVSAGAPRRSQTRAPHHDGMHIGQPPHHHHTPPTAPPSPPTSPAVQAGQHKQKVTQCTNNGCTLM